MADIQSIKSKLAARLSIHSQLIRRGQEGSKHTTRRRRKLTQAPKLTHSYTKQAMRNL